MRTCHGLMITILPDLFLTVLGIVPGAMTGVDQSGGPAMAAEPLDINTATADQLKALPGIGEAYSAKIINGWPYKRKDELVQKKVIPPATYDLIEDPNIATHKFCSTL